MEEIGHDVTSTLIPIYIKTALLRAVTYFKRKVTQPQAKTGIYVENQ